MNLDQLLAFHCAPALTRMKPANLIAHDRIKQDEIINRYNETQKHLNTKGIQMERLWTCPKRELTLVYDRMMLDKHLSSPEVWGYLMVQGYPMYSGFESIISHLKVRMIESGGFPHEIGVFLGYPLVDVLGFIRNNGQNCKLCGYWKVYGDPVEAQDQFEAFTKVRTILCDKVKQGCNIIEALEGADLVA